MIAVDRKERRPLHQQIYDGYRAAVLQGELHPGDRIPSSRDLARDLSVSRFPVLNAYAQLLAEGYLETRDGSGTFVSRSLPEQQMSLAQAVGDSTHTISGARPVARRNSLYPAFRLPPMLRGWGSFGVHQPALDQFPFAVWSSLVCRYSQNPHVSSFHRIDPLGSERLRDAIRDYLELRAGSSARPIRS